MLNVSYSYFMHCYYFRVKFAAICVCSLRESNWLIEIQRKTKCRCFVWFMLIVQFFLFSFSNDKVHFVLQLADNSYQTSWILIRLPLIFCLYKSNHGVYSKSKRHWAITVAIGRSCLLQVLFHFLIIQELAHMFAKKLWLL